jgi:solute carrier family 25 S-adenosylmethionine transporter 26
MMGPLHYYLRVSLAGGLAGATGSLVLYPIDSAKTLRQADPSRYGSVRAALLTMVQSRDVGRIYRGILPAVVGAVPSSALYFGAYESSKAALQRWLIPRQRRDGGGGGEAVTHRLLVHGLAAAAGNVVSSFVFVPKEVIKQQLQYRASITTSNIPHKATSILTIVQDKGISGLYCGYGATLMRNIPSAMIRFVLYEELKRKWDGGSRLNFDRSSPGNRPTNALGLFCAGAVAGSTASFLMTPIDVLKTRMATGTCPSGVVNGMVHILNQVGWRGLYAGAGSRVLSSGAFSAIGFGTFELLKQLFCVASINAPEGGRETGR